MVAILLNPVTHIVAFILESASAEDFLPHLRRPLPERSSHILSDCSFAMHFLESRQSSHEPSLNPSLCSLNRLSLSILHGDPSLGIVISLEFSVSSLCVFSVVVLLQIHESSLLSSPTSKFQPPDRSSYILSNCGLGLYPPYFSPSSLIKRHYTELPPAPGLVPALWAGGFVC